MTIRAALRRIFRSAPPTPIELPAAPPLTPAPLKISDGVIEALSARPVSRQSPFTGLPTPPPGVRPDAVPVGMAMDDAAGSRPGGAWGAWAQSGLWGEGLWFPGYPYLAELAQRPEYRNIFETVAEEMTRKWVKLLSSGKKNKTKTIKTLEDAMKRLGLRECFHRGMELDGSMGMGLIYVDVNDAWEDPAELAAPLMIDPRKIPKGTPIYFQTIDPTWCSPKYYNSTDPLRPDFFKPSAWYVMGKEVHATRLLIIRSREVPDILKAAYNFGGISLSQMSKPYVDNWLRTRQSVSDLLHAFTVFVLKTNLQLYLANAQQLLARLSAFVLGRDNKGLMMVDKDTEDLSNVSAPLGSLDKLQAQAQEQMAFPAQQPLIKFVGYTPTGLNADTDTIIRSWYDRVHAKQEKTFGAPLTDALKIIQLSETGEIDPEITFEFVGLWELDEAGKAAVQKTKADTASVLISDGVLSNEEERARQASDPESMYHGLEGPAPEQPEEEIDPSLTDPSERIDTEAEAGQTTGANSGA